MKRVFFALASMAALMGTAAAADLEPRPAPQPYYKAPVAMQVYNWTGFYIGINSGGGFGRSQWDSDRQLRHFRRPGGRHRWLQLSVRPRLSSASKATSTGPTSTAPPTPSAGSAARPATIGSRPCAAGSATPPTASCPSSPAAPRSAISAPRPRASPAPTPPMPAGRSAAGLEFAIAGNWTAKAEYLYVDLGKLNCGISCGAFATDNVSFTTNIVRAGVNYHF